MTKPCANEAGVKKFSEVGDREPGPAPMSSRRRNSLDTLMVLDDPSAAGAMGEAQATRRLGLKVDAVESLSEQTRKYLHVNMHGKPIPEWMDWDKQPELNRWNYYMSQLHTLMTDGTSSTAAVLVSNFMVLTILVSVISFCLETIPGFQEHRNPAANKVFTWIEAVTIQIFAIDYLLRFISSPAKLKFVIEPFNIIDLISIVPWYIITFIGSDFNGTTVFRVVRLFRVFRVLKLGGRYSKLLVVLGALQKSLDMLGLMVFLISLCIVFFATLMYYAERGEWNAELGYYVRPNEVAFFADPPVPKPSPYESIVSGFWWAVVTLMTVGYGDVFPITAAGKFIASLAVMCGVLSLALPISVVGTTFSNDWEAHVREEERRKNLATRKTMNVTSPMLTKLQQLLNDHLGNVDTLSSCNRASELALDDSASAMHGRIKATKKHLHTEAKADLRLRKAAKRLVDLEGLEYDRQYGYLPQEHVKDRFREPLDSMSQTAKLLSSRACHVTRMEAVNSILLDPELAATVARLSKKHADLQFLLCKFEEQPEPLALLEAELSDLRTGMAECASANAAARMATMPTSGRTRPASGDGGVHSSRR